MAERVTEQDLTATYSERLYNEDLRPLKDHEREWTTYSLLPGTRGWLMPRRSVSSPNKPQRPP